MVKSRNQVAETMRRQNRAGVKKASRAPAEETQAQLLRGAAQTLAEYLELSDSPVSSTARALVLRQMAMCEKAADDVERLADALQKMATP